MHKQRLIRIVATLVLCMLAIDLPAQTQESTSAFPYTVTEQTKHRELSVAMHRSFFRYPAPRPEDNERYSQFKYTELKGFDYHGGDGTISRRDPTKVILENGRYYVWYTRRSTPTVPQGPERCTDTIPSTDWDLAEIWCATSDDGFTWQEQSVAVPRPPKPHPGWRSIATPGILKFDGRYYLYYQAFPFKKGVACLSIRDGQEHFTVQYAEDWVNFEIASITELMPVAAGPFVPDAFDDSGNGRGITWGLSHFKNAARVWSRQHSVLTRFDCDLSLDVDDPEMKKSHIDYPPEHHYKFGLSRKQRERIDEQNRQTARKQQKAE